MDQDIKPCFFCLNTTKFKIEGKVNKSCIRGKDDKYYDRMAFTVRCNKCHARGPTASVTLPRRYSQVEYEEAQKQAIEKWNNRFLEI